MSDWGFFDWLAYASTWVAAIVIAATAAIKSEAELREKIPTFLKAPIWGFVPIGLLAIGLALFIFAPENKPPAQLMIDYGVDGAIMYLPSKDELTPPNPSSHIIVNGSDLSSLSRKKYRLLGFICHLPLTNDRNDVSNISKSALFEIRDERITIPILWNSTFIKEFKAGVRNTDYTLLALPVGVSPDQFDTLRQAVALGAKILEERGGPP